MSILLIEDDTKVAAEIIAAFTAIDRAVTHAVDGNEGLALALRKKYQVIVTDRMLPGLDGLEILRKIRVAGVTTPVLLLSALDSVDERVRGLRAGGDDYLGKPFSIDELVARVESLVRRTETTTVTRLTVADLELDLIGRQVTRAGRPLDLTSREFRLLEVLMRNAGQVVTRAMLLEIVWDMHFDPQTNVVDVHVSRLRQTIDRDFTIPLIHTVRGAGYSLHA
ncbi:MAG: winged helix-turn-helix domain-containing protein [Steroidobacteraceae bacterium]